MTLVPLSTTRSQEIVCSICLDSIDRDTNISTTICNHIFHTHCLLLSARERPHCPLCRADLFNIQNDRDIQEQRNIQRQQNCPRSVIHNIMAAYESDQLSNNVAPNNLLEVLTDLINPSRNTSELLNNLVPYHIENTYLSTNSMINIVMDAIIQDVREAHETIRARPAYRHLSNTLYNILQNNSVIENPPLN